MKIDGASFEYKGEILTFKVCTYVVNKRPCLVLFQDNNLYKNISMNITAANIQSDEIIIQTWENNTGIIDYLRSSEFFEDTGRKEDTSFIKGQAEVWRLKNGYTF